MIHRPGPGVSVPLGGCQVRLGATRTARDGRRQFQSRGDTPEVTDAIGVSSGCSADWHVGSFVSEPCQNDPRFWSAGRSSNAPVRISCQRCITRSLLISSHLANQTLAVSNLNSSHCACHRIFHLSLSLYPTFHFHPLSSSLSLALCPGPGSRVCCNSRLPGYWCDCHESVSRLLERRQ